jgi:ubiquinone/menaquinone biosynthesis C-methylase UbiE
MPTLMVPGRLFAAFYDKMNAEVEETFGARMRSSLLASAEGSVVEIGAGTGINVEHYPASVERLVLTEPDRHMRAKLQARLGESGRAAEVVDASADALPFAEDTFDVAVATLVLCTVPDPAATVRELVRVLRPGGRLLFAEHVRSVNPRTARMQDAVRPLWQVVARGCHPNRDTLAAITAAGFEVERVERVIVPKLPSVAHEAIVGVARKPA